MVTNQPKVLLDDVLVRGDVGTESWNASVRTTRDILKIRVEFVGVVPSAPTWMKRFGGSMG